uniref:Alpha/beta hydrolase n=1 Tax=Thermofilum pendens TaxID=2269 RepID=A0A7C3WNQ9_THEPE
MSTASKSYIKVGSSMYAFLHRKEAGKTVVLIHGNLSSSRIWLSIVEKIPEGFEVVAPDLCGFGDTLCPGIDATRGFATFTEEVVAILDSLGVRRAVFVGHSMGGGVVFDLLVKHPDRVETAVLVDPMSPYGWGGTKGVHGEPCYPDYSGSGGGLIRVYNPFFLQVLEKLKRGTPLAEEERQLLEATVSLYFAPGYTPGEEIRSAIFEALKQARLGDDFYPGDYAESPNWPYVAPGTRGVLNAMSPKYFNARHALAAAQKPPVIWVHGSLDQMVSDSSVIDVGFLGKSGFIPNYPGEDVYPPQPMFSQIKAFLEEYQDRGGSVEVRIINGAGHTPFIEKKAEFLGVLEKVLV